jgi:hypothetical protein
MNNNQIINKDTVSPELKKANTRVAIILGCLALASLIMAGVGVSRMMAVGA